MKEPRITVKISMHANQKWRGFTLQKGHFFGQHEAGFYYVTSLSPQDDGCKFYYLNVNDAECNWEAIVFGWNTPLVRACEAKKGERYNRGMSCVSGMTLNGQFRRNPAPNRMHSASIIIPKGV